MTTFLLSVEDKRTRYGTGVRKFTLPSDVIAYMENHKVYQVGVFRDGYGFSMTPAKFRSIYS
jgi:hypothetical protein